MVQLDVLIASIARHTLWITDAYFIASTLYITALKRAAHDGVDVRILVPRSSDIRWIATLSRTLYRPLLESGIRVFEWNGSMMHAKTAVADFRWARIGSTNLNIFSWLTNRELDLSVEDEKISTQLAERFLKDLNNATEIVLSGFRGRPRLVKPRPRDILSFMPLRGHRKASAGAVTRQIARIADALKVVTKETRAVETSEAISFLFIGVFFCLLSILAISFPQLIALPFALLMGIFGIAIGTKSLALYRKKWRQKKSMSLTKKP
jgi:CDP-diacylglycerol--glycerol-3-phosphate 3-phosphatidyltransferase/cardiolipin synthase